MKTMTSYVLAFGLSCLMTAFVMGTGWLVGLRIVPADSLSEVRELPALRSQLGELRELRGTVATLRDQLAVEQIEKALLWRRKLQTPPPVADENVKEFFAFLKLEAAKDFVKRGTARLDNFASREKARRGSKP